MPREATRKAMGQITNAIIGIMLVLVAVFVPMAFFLDPVGIIDRQLSVTMVAAIGFSALMALSLTPAWCATLLKPIEEGDAHAVRKACPAGSIAACRARASAIAAACVDAAARRPRHAGVPLARWWASAGVPSAARRVPAGRRPRLHHHRRADPAGGVVQPDTRCRAAGRGYLINRNGVEAVTFLTGFSFLGQGQNAAQAFVTLKDWSERGPKDLAALIVADANRTLSSIKDAKVSACSRC